MIQQEILKDLTLHVGNGGMSLKLELEKDRKENKEKEGKCQDTKK